MKDTTIELKRWPIQPLSNILSFIIALLINNTGFGPGFSFSDWQTLEPHVGLSFAELEMDKSVH